MHNHAHRGYALPLDLLSDGYIQLDSVVLAIAQWTRAEGFDDVAADLEAASDLVFARLAARHRRREDFKKNAATMGE